MKTRIITALILLAATLPILIFSGTVAFPIAAAVLSFIGVFEMLRCLGFGKSKSVLLPSLLLAVLLPLGTMLFHHAAWREALRLDLISYLVVCFSAIFFYMVYMFAAGLVFRGAWRFSDVASALVMVLYIVFCFTAIALLRLQEQGLFLMLLVFIGPLLTDAFAYFTGVFFGKHKLLPEISPKKTVEGSIGGTVLGSASVLLYGLIVSLITKNVEGMTPLTPNYLMLGINGLIVSLFSQVGDLTTSWIKREHGIKDYGKIFPGHGGVMDRFDSVLITAPILLFFSTFTGDFAMFTPIL